MYKTNLDLVNECDNFPWPEQYGQPAGDETRHWSFHVQDVRASLGYIPDWVIEQMPWSESWIINEQQKQLILLPDRADETELSSRARRDLAVASQLEIARQNRVFKVLEGWRNERYAVYGPDRAPLVTMERAGSALFGIVTYGVHLTAYVKHGGDVRVWTPRRSKTKSTYPGYLDNTVAGGISSNEEPLECLVREAQEEASLPEKYVRNHVKACGSVTYFHVRDARAGGETGLFQPECQYVYDLELPESTVPAPDDNEAEDFQLMSVGMVQDSLAAGRFKPNCALVLLDFFVRHGILTPENEKGYIEIVSRLHRRLPFPTR